MPGLVLLLLLAAFVSGAAADLCVVRVEDPAAAGSVEAQSPH